jgi:Protein of unknown function (DUF2889)
MPLPPPTAPRTRIHKRAITVEGYRRDDGWFDIEGRLIDAKDHDFKVASGMRRAGVPVHDMWVRMTIDESRVIRAVEAASDAMPYVGECDRITPAYKKLIGMKIEAGFRLRVLQLMGGIKGCTHLTEIVCVMASGAVQTMAGQLPSWHDPEHRPFQINGCHALADSGEAVRVHYPRWYRAPG